MVRSFIFYDEDTMSVQIENTRIGSTQNRIGIVRHGN